MESKTLAEWFDTLPEEIREKAKNNTDVPLTVKRESLSEALIGAFDWGASEEGYPYWARLHSKYDIG